MRMIAVAIVGLALSPPLVAKPAPVTRTAQIDSIFAGMSSPDAPGCVVGVSDKGRVVRRAYGLAELDHRVPLTADSILEAGSISKQFTAAAILLLVEDGKLSLTDDVRRVIPELPDYGRAITIDHLLNHSSGLRDWGVVAEIGGWPRSSRAHTQADALDIIRRQRSLNYAPGEEYSYTNSGYNLLTEIVRRVSGKSLADFTRDRMFVPLGMTKTSWRDDFRRVVRGRATAYDRTPMGFAQLMAFEDVYGNGGLLTTVSDLLTWNAALADNRLGASVTARLQEPARLNGGTAITYARGLYVERHHGVPAITHNGATAGYRSWLGRFPDQQLSVAVLCNRGDAPMIVMGKQVADLYLPDLSPPSIYPPYVGPDRSGLYVNQRTGQSVTFVTADGRAMLDGVRLTTPSPGLLRGASGDLRIVGPDAFRVTNPQGQSSDYRRAARVTPSPAELASLAGRYASDEADATYIVTAEAGELRLRLDRRPGVTRTLKPTYADAFEADGMVVRFVRDAAGKVAALTIGLPRVRAIRFDREPERR